MPTPEQDSRLQVVSYTRDVEGHAGTLLYALKSRTSLRRIVALSFCAAVPPTFCSLLSESNGDSSTAFLTMDEAMVKTRFMEAVVSAPYCVEATALREARLSIACCICRRGSCIGAQVLEDQEKICQSEWSRLHIDRSYVQDAIVPCEPCERPSLDVVNPFAPLTGVGARFAGRD